ncbi:hypothetical protein [Candidatus Nitrosotenuis uzonensis]|nr:hypothetical protein [Candidatus Nitrosotenuis uzonensis]
MERKIMTTKRILRSFAENYLVPESNSLQHGKIETGKEIHFYD